MEGLKGSEHQSTFEGFFDFIYAKTGTSKAVILPTLEVISKKPHG